MLDSLLLRRLQHIFLVLRRQGRFQGSYRHWCFQGRLHPVSWELLRAVDVGLAGPEEGHTTRRHRRWGRNTPTAVTTVVIENELGEQARAAARSRLRRSATGDEGPRSGLEAAEGIGKGSSNCWRNNENKEPGGQRRFILAGTATTISLIPVEQSCKCGLITMSIVQKEPIRIRTLWIPKVVQRDELTTARAYGSRMLNLCILNDIY